jgi:thiamine-monophosphate kinase
MTRLADIGEFEAIQRILASRVPGPGVAVGPGDDAAVLRPTEGMRVAATTDAFVEGVHYRPGDLTDLELGARLAAANLSDLAACAATPRWGLISMGVRAETPIATLVDRDRGLAQALRAHGASLVGGNLAKVQGPEWMSLTLIGECAPDRVWTRLGARPGDLIAVTGYPGRAAAGLAMITANGRAAAGAEWWTPLYLAYAAPASRVEFARALAATHAVHAAIDVSDGLAADLGHLCDASEVGVELREADWPDDPVMVRAATERGVDATRWAWGPSDDYELLLALPAEARERAVEAARAAGTPLTILGACTQLETLVWVGRDGSRRELPRAGYDHFR